MNKFLKTQSLVAVHTADLSKSHPEWFDQYETADFTAGITDELVDLLESAPNGFAAGLIYGKLSAIQSVSALTTMVKPAFRSPVFQTLLSPLPAIRVASSHRPHARTSYPLLALPAA
jgi:hypothetical protein